VSEAEVIHAYYAAFNRADWDGMCALMSDDVAHDLNQGERQLGRAAFRSFLDRMARCYRERLRDVVVLTGADGRAAAEYIVEGEYLAADEGLPAARGQRYVLPGGAFFEIEGGQIRRVTNYYNVADWLRQVRA
jgi:steroid delta-isomerase-like uncharacterized protein